MVTDTEPHNHQTVFYSFDAGGVTYSSSGTSDPPNPLAGELAIGDDLYVVYDQTDPNVSCPCDPYNESVTWWQQFLAGMFLSSIIAAVITAGLGRGRWRA